MFERVDLAKVEFGHDDAKRPTAVVTFRVTDENDLPSAINFNVDIMARHDGDVDGTVRLAQRAFHALMASLAEKTEDWVR